MAMNDRHDGCRGFRLDTYINIATTSVINNNRNDIYVPTPPPDVGNFLLLNGQNFLLLDGENMSIL